MRKLFFSLTFLVVAAALVLGMFGSTASANPPGDTRDPDVGKMLYKFNVIVKPNPWAESDDECTNSGHRVFFAMDQAPWEIYWEFVVNAPGNYDITDCDGTEDGNATIEVNENQRVYIMIRVLGPNKPENNLDLTCTELVDLGVDEVLCLIDTANFGKSNEFTKITQHIVDSAYEEVLWTLDPDTGFKILEVRVYEKL